MEKYFEKLIILILLFGLLMPFSALLAQNEDQGAQEGESDLNIPFRIIKGVASSSKPFLNKIREKIGPFFENITQKIETWWKGLGKDWASKLWQDFLGLIEREITIK